MAIRTHNFGISLGNVVVTNGVAAIGLYIALKGVCWLMGKCHFSNGKYERGSRLGYLPAITDRSSNGCRAIIFHQQ